MNAPAKVEGKKKDKSFRDFKGVNTQSDRRVIDDDEFAWLENVQPVGMGNARALGNATAAVVTLGVACYYMAEGNLSNVSYMYMFSTDGSCTQVNLTSYATTTVGAAGTFSGTTSRICQWQNSQICIIDVSKGYFTWDGTTLTAYKGTVQSVTVNIGGTGFTNATTTTLTPSSGSASFSCTLSCNLATLQAAGTNYIVGDVLTVTGGTFTSACTITVSAINVATGAITGINLNNPGIYTIYPGANPVSVTGGHGTLATFNLTFGIYQVAVVSPGSGYVSAPTITVAGAGAGVNAQLTVNMGITANGTTLATYAGRVWIGNGRTIVFSAAGSYSDFNPLDLAGSLIMSDDTLRTNISRLYSANNYLYIFGGSSVNIISNVTVTNPTLSSTGTIIIPSAVTFSNTNLSSNMGTDNADSIVPLSRTLMYASDYGFFGITGSTPQKISQHLDGIFPYLNFNIYNATGGTVIINGIQTLCYLVSYADPVAGTRPLLCLFSDKKWYFASQTTASPIVFIAQASPDPDVPTMWGTDGLNLYQLFANTTANIAQTVKTKLWDMGSPLVTKQALKVGLECIPSTAPATFTVSVDTEYTSNTISFGTGNTMVWYNNAGNIISWTNNVGQAITWLSSGYNFLRSDVNNVGNYLGQTVTSSAPGNVYIGFHFQYEPRTPWTGIPW